MKRTIILVAAMIACGAISAQTNEAVDEGYLFTSNLKTYSQRTVKSRVKSTIHAGRVAVKYENNDFRFPCVDATEYFTLGSGTFHKYYPLSQDIVPAEYIVSAAFNKAVRKVSISQTMPASWQMGRAYSLKAACSTSYIKSIVVKPLRLSRNNVTLVTEVDVDFKPSSSADISGETIVEISLNEDKVYFYKGQQIVPARNLNGNDYYTLVVDDNGVTYAKSEKGGRQTDSKLSYVFGMYPDIDYIGWISDKEFVLDDILFVVE